MPTVMALEESDGLEGGQVVDAVVEVVVVVDVSDVSELVVVEIVTVSDVNELVVVEVVTDVVLVVVWMTDMGKTNPLGPTTASGTGSTMVKINVPTSMACVTGSPSEATWTGALGEFTTKWYVRPKSSNSNPEVGSTCQSPGSVPENPGRRSRWISLSQVYPDHWIFWQRPPSWTSQLSGKQGWHKKPPSNKASKFNVEFGSQSVRNASKLAL